MACSSIASTFLLLVLLAGTTCTTASFENVRSAFHKVIAQREHLLKIGKEGLEERAKQIYGDAKGSVSTLTKDSSVDHQQSKKHHAKKPAEEHDGRKLQTGYEWIRLVLYPMMGCQGEPEFFQAGMLNECQAGLMIGGNMASKKYVAIHPSTIGGDFYFQEHWYFGQTCSGAVQAVYDIGMEVGVPANYQYGECTDVIEVQYISANEDVMPDFEGFYFFDGADGCVQDNNLVHTAGGQPFGVCSYFVEEDVYEMYSSEGCPAEITYKVFPGSDATCSTTPTAVETLSTHLCELDLEYMKDEISHYGATVFEYNRIGCWPVGMM